MLLRATVLRATVLPLCLIAGLHEFFALQRSRWLARLAQRWMQRKAQT